jgi:hypothetical protein
MRLSTKEIDVVRVCLDWLALHKIMAWRCNNTGIFDPKRKVFRSFQGLKGVSDILGIIPRTVDLDGAKVTFGSFLAVEVKKPGESLREDQAAFLEGIRQRGGIGLCVHSLRELEEQMHPFMV